MLARLGTLALLLLAALAAAVPGHAAIARDGSSPVQVTALAVAEDAQGTFRGVHATVTAQVLAHGTGQVFVATKPLAQTDMQGSARLASRVAAATLGVAWDRQDYLVSFASGSAVIGGPSAGAVMTLALTAALHDLTSPGDPWTLADGVAATGTINPDGTIGPVGGIPAKAEGAKDAGLRTFLYPAGLDTATTQVNGQTVAVDMQRHCADLGLACKPVATLSDVLAEAAGVRISAPEEPVPGTADYAEALGPSVTRQVDDLASRVAAAVSDPRLAGLSASERARVQEDTDTAQERLDAAQAALGDGRYYLAATRSFQGAISAGTAENLTAFFDQGRARAVLTAAVTTCQAEAQEAREAVAGLRSDGLNELYAIGSAQQRSGQADELAQQASQQAQTGTVEGAIAAFGTAAFCDERAGTVSWWAGLRDDFGPGPEVGDLEALARDAVDEAREMVAYAAAVLGGASGAEQRLADAEAQLADGEPDAAVVSAIDAHTSASVAMQTGGVGAPVPAEVLDAARQSAARAIAAARADGIEPLLAVSLVELSQDQEDAGVALGNLWSARSFALLGRSQPAVDVGTVQQGGGSTGLGADGGRGDLGGFLLVLGIGAAVAIVAAIWAGIASRR